MKKVLFLLSFVLLLTACQSETVNVCTYKDVEYEPGESYFDGCNWHTCNDDGSFVGTEKGCGTLEEPIYKD